MTANNKLTNNTRTHTDTDTKEITLYGRQVAKKTKDGRQIITIKKRK